MAELNVQPKKKSPILWIILAIIALALIFYFVRGGSEKKTTSNLDTVAKDTVAKTVVDWNQVDFNSPKASYEEITDKGVIVRGSGKYTIYGIGENILFAKGKSTIQSGAQSQLKQIASSLKKRFDGASLAIYGNTDATGTAVHNRALGADRAKAVRQWLIDNGIAEEKIIVQSKGESDPVATNATAKGQQLNRSVEIVALADKKQ